VDRDCFFLQVHEARSNAPFPRFSAPPPFFVLPMISAPSEDKTTALGPGFGLTSKEKREFIAAPCLSFAMHVPSRYPLPGHSRLGQAFWLRLLLLSLALKHHWVQLLYLPPPVSFPTPTRRHFPFAFDVFSLFLNKLWLFLSKEMWVFVCWTSKVCQCRRFPSLHPPCRHLNHWYGSSMASNNEPRHLCSPGNVCLYLLFCPF